jgi:hypothetical protein
MKVHNSKYGVLKMHGIQVMIKSALRVEHVFFITATFFPWPKWQKIRSIDGKFINYIADKLR